MKTNTYKQPPKEPKVSKLTQMVEKMGLGVRVDNISAFKYMPYLIFITFLGIIYIANTFRAEKLHHRINKMQKEVELMRVDYQTLKYDFINASKRSKIAEKVKKMGLIDSNKPPVVIEVDDLEQ
ncbi:FtsL-like putative cell division protein [Limibacter armeniacum]|uniref:FtsL-like putative cell division protein n=1 Tax=Limibacter armeniacum TaxID=466084 RepID=UPI002FE66712